MVTSSKTIQFNGHQGLVEMPNICCIKPISLGIKFSIISQEMSLRIISCLNWTDLGHSTKQIPTKIFFFAPWKTFSYFPEKKKKQKREKTRLKEQISWFKQNFLHLPRNQFLKLTRKKFKKNHFRCSFFYISKM